MTFISAYKPQAIFDSGFLESLSQGLKSDPKDFRARVLEIETCLVTWFDIDDTYQQLQKKLQDLEWIPEFRRRIMQKVIAHRFNPAMVQGLTAEHFQDFIAQKDEHIARRALSFLDDDVALYCAWRLWHPDPDQRGIFKLPESLVTKDYLNPTHDHGRNNFDLCDHAPSSHEGYWEATYCLYCHKNNKDTCRTGITDTPKKGCPVDLPISEMTHLYAQGHPLAALILAMHKHPMILATGHRICNNCMKSCLFQKQEAVNVPAIESQIVDKCLNLPWGFEIIYLLSYWDPLQDQPPRSCAQPVLVVGMGPAGMTLCHQLLRYGHQVVALEGLMVTPLPESLKQQPIQKFADLKVPLSERRPQGVGGVMEYGITSRWEKNRLTALRLILERHPHFALIGSTRFGDTFSFSEAFQWGFQHVSLALGAGKPNIPKLDQALAKGVHLASDFLMTLHHGMAFHEKSLNSLILTSPLVVVGGGLTAVDAATEALAYLKSQGISNPHVTLLYRRDFKDSPSYTLNPLEVTEALAQGIKIKDHHIPIRLNLDKTGHVRSITCIHQGQPIDIQANHVILATGTDKNSILSAQDYLQQSFKFPGKISIIGDLDPNFEGSVVKAIASAMTAAPVLHQHLVTQPQAKLLDLQEFATYFSAHVEAITEVAADIFELILHAPHQARSFQPGQFYRVLPFSDTKEGPFFKPLALSGIAVEGDKLTLLIVGKGASSLLCKNLYLGQRLSLMGPNGTPSLIPKNQRVLLVGAGLGNAILLPIAKAMKQAGCSLDYMALYDSPQKTFYEDKLRSTVDRFTLTYTPDSIFEFLPTMGPWDHGLVMTQGALAEKITHYLQQHDLIKHLEIAVNTPMFCMMQGVCGQCLQRHVTEQGEESWIFSCAQQDQDAKTLDFKFLQQRRG